MCTKLILKEVEINLFSFSIVTYFKIKSVFNLVAKHLIIQGKLSRVLANSVFLSFTFLTTNLLINRHTKSTYLEN